MRPPFPPILLHRYTTPTPIGDFLLLVDADGAVCLANWTDCETDAVAALRRAYAPHPLRILSADGPGEESPPPANDPRGAVRAYFATPSADNASRPTGGAALSGVRLRLAPAPPFTTRVWQQLGAVGAGRTWTYGMLAAKCGNPRASRAVGQAMHGNHICLFLPCHRVVGATRAALTGFGSGLWRKEFLLRHEGSLEGISTRDGRREARKRQRT